MFIASLKCIWSDSHTCALCIHIFMLKYFFYNRHRRRTHTHTRRAIVAREMNFKDCARKRKRKRRKNIFLQFNKFSALFYKTKREKNLKFKSGLWVEILAQMINWDKGFRLGMGHDGPQSCTWQTINSLIILKKKSDLRVLFGRD